MRKFLTRQNLIGTAEKNPAAYASVSERMEVSRKGGMG